MLLISTKIHVFEPVSLCQTIILWSVDNNKWFIFPFFHDAFIVLESSLWIIWVFGRCSHGIFVLFNNSAWPCWPPNCCRQGEDSAWEPGPVDRRRWADEVTLGSADRLIWTRPGTRACYSRFNGREEEARTGPHKASDIRWGQWSIFYACRVLWPEQKLILIVNLALLLFSALYK